MESTQDPEPQPRRFGVKVARTYAEGPGLNVTGKRPLIELQSGVDRHMPGKIISQRVISNKKSVYVAVYQDSTKETLTEEKLRHYSGIYTNASVRSGSPIKPLIVRMK